MKHLLPLCLILSAAGAFAQTTSTPSPAIKLESCPSGTNTTYASVPTNTALPIVWSTVSTGDAGPNGQATLKCTPIAQAQPASWYVKYSTDGGSTWKWALLAALTAPAPPVTVPPAATTAMISWTAPTTDTTGAALTVPLTYNLYRGASATGLTLLKNVSGLSTTDTVTVAGTYWYSVTALNGTAESAQANPVSAQLGAGVVVSPAPPTGVTVK